MAATLEAKQVNTPEEREERYQRALRRAQEIIDQSWLEAGYTREDLGQSAQIGDLFQRLLAEGWRADDLLKDWQNKSAEEILREYAPPPKVAVL
jgi:hypothetical protein